MQNLAHLAQILSYHLETFRNQFPSLIYIQNRPDMIFSNPCTPLEADAHFVSYVITRDSQIWFYDGVLYKSNPQMEYCGLLTTVCHDENSPLEFCRGGQASLAVYERR